MKPKSLTPVEEELVAVLRSRNLRGEPSPTYREICAEFGWSSTATVRDHLRALARKGIIELSQGRARSIRLKREPKAMVPVLGRVSAGVPVQAEQNIEGAVRVLPGWITDGTHFAVRVSGDSMKEAGILDGDHVVMKTQGHASDGDIVVAVIDGETTLKRLRKRGRTWWLVPENERYRPIAIRPQAASVQGVMVGLLRGKIPRSWKPKRTFSLQEGTTK